MATVFPTPDDRNEQSKSLVPSSANVLGVPKQPIDLRRLGQGELEAITHAAMCAMKDVLCEQRERGKKLDPTSIHLDSDNDLAQKILPPIFSMIRRDAALAPQTNIEFATIKDMVFGEIVRLFSSEFVEEDERTPGDDPDTILEDN